MTGGVIGGAPATSGVPQVRQYLAVATLLAPHRGQAMDDVQNPLVS